MAEESRLAEHVLAEIENGGERRTVSLVQGESMALVERSSGPQTQVAYGTSYHGHKILCSVEAFSIALGVEEAHVLKALDQLFADASQVPLLSEIMDRLDMTGQSYRYMAWSGVGDVVFRSELKG